MLRRYLSSRFRLLAFLSAFLAGVGVTIFSWWIGLICLLVAAALDFLSFFLGWRAEAADELGFADLVRRFSKQ